MKKTEKQQNALKGVMLPFEKFGCLRNLPVDEAGEIIQTVLAYGMDGTKPEFKDKLDGSNKCDTIFLLLCYLQIQIRTFTLKF